MKLSVIIPIYKAEKYIASCLDSLLKQDIPLSDYEIIVINDGSPDNSGIIVAGYESNYPNIKQYKTENRGPGSARNKGLKYAQGDYIWFVDGDDLVAENCIKGLLEYADRYNLDFCEFDYTEVNNNSEKLIEQNNRLFGHVVSNAEFIRDYAMPYHPWHNICKRQIFIENHVFFAEGIFHEDLEMNIRILEHCRRISYYRNQGKGLYYYILEREGSTMTNKSIEHTKKRIDSYVFIIKQMKNNYAYDKNRLNYAFYVQRLLNDILAYSFVSLICDSNIANKPAFYKKIVTENNLDYSAHAATGLSYYKFSILSVVRRNYYLTLFFLKLFDQAGKIFNTFRGR